MRGHGLWCLHSRPRPAAPSGPELAGPEGQTEDRQRTGGQGVFFKAFKNGNGDKAVACVCDGGEEERRMWSVVRVNGRVANRGGEVGWPCRYRKKKMRNGTAVSSYGQSMRWSP
jgi:hypothetical protein